MFQTPFTFSRESLHEAAERTLALQREGADVFVAQMKLANKQLGASMEAWEAMVATQQKAAFAMGKVLVDAVAPKAAQA